MDAIVTAFACSKQAPCSEWAAQWFNEQPRVIWVPGANSTQFESVGGAITNLPSWVAQRSAGVQPHRIAIVTFSAGWAFVHEILKRCSGAVDSVILLDGLHSRDLAYWQMFAARAAKGDATSPLLIMAHTHITPPFVATRVTNYKVFEAAIASNPNAESQLLPAYVNVAPELPVTLGTDVGGHRTIAVDPLLDVSAVGGCWKLAYAGDDAAAHQYVAWHVQPRLWRWLAERWNADPDAGVVV